MVLDSYENLILLTLSARSGSTLLSKILNSHPDIHFFNEVITQAKVLLPSFDQEFYEGSDVDVLKDAFACDFFPLLSYKLVPEKLALKSKNAKFLIFLLCKSLNSFLQRLSPNYRWHTFHKIYHINSLHEPPFIPLYRTTFLNHKSPRYLLLKEVHPYKSFLAINKIYPGAVFIHLIRSPFGCVSSALRSQPDRKKVFVYKDWLRKVAPNYNSLIERYADGPIEQQIALNWRISNELIAISSVDSSVSVKTVIFEDLVESKSEISKSIFSFLNLTQDLQVEKFLRRLERNEQSQKHQRSVLTDKKQPSLPHDLTHHQISLVSEVVNGSHLITNWAELISRLGI